MAALLIGFMKAGFGGGVGMLATPLVVSVMPAKQAVGLMLPLLIATDIVALTHYWGKWSHRNVLTLLPGAFLGILLGGQLLGILPDLYLKKTIGGIACAFGLFGTYRNRFFQSGTTFKVRRSYGILAGLVTGIISTLAHIGGVITTMYLLPQGLSNRAFVGTATAVFFLINLIKLGPYIQLGLLTGSNLQQDLYLLPAVVIGALVGIWANQRISRALFSKVVLVLVLATGVRLLIV